MVWFYGV